MHVTPMPRRRARLARAGPGLLACAALLPLVAPAWAETANVQYVSEAAVYLDVGAAAGLQKDSEARVVREGQVVAVLVVEYVAAQSASCRIVSGGGVRVGDRVDFEAIAGTREPGESRGAASAASRRQPGSVWSGLGNVRGRVATLYTRSSEEDGVYQNPAASALLRWVGAGREDFSIRIRGDRPSFDDSDVQAVSVRDARDVRLFEARVRYQTTGARLALEGGRFVPAELDGMGSLDGGSIVWRPAPALRLGATGGRSVTNGVRGFASHLGHAYGGFIGTQRGGSDHRWSALASWTRLQDPDVTRRQFAVLRSDATIGRVRFYQRVEVDANPMWKRELGEKPTELTAWSLGNELRVRRRTSVTVSLDSRRPILLPEVRESIENLQLDRLYAVRGALRIGVGRFQVLRVGARYGWRPPGDTTTRSWDAGLLSSRLFHDRLSAGVRVDSYRSDTASNAHVSANLRLRASSRVGLAAAGGAGRQESAAAFFSTVQTEKNFNWVRLGADLRASNGLWFDVSSEWQDRNRGNELSVAAGRVF